MALWCACSLKVLLLKYLILWKINSASPVCIYIRLLSRNCFETVGHINLLKYRSAIVRESSTSED